MENARPTNVKLNDFFLAGQALIRSLITNALAKINSCLFVMNHISSPTDIRVRIIQP
ncbi:hypothetical protein LHGZ1_0705 [Laribacter hongkongensis]|uniref:Uncharacterized protein n=1 Tax=Laribacter hongkongensis TaxID=168471 RepID=A0A248LGI2_9NEIS|nr:hypothetical protein LHGZ1_0705 [Laribacter hongkongensis]